MSIAWQEWEMFFKVCAHLFVCVCVEEKEKETDWFAASSRKKSSQQRYVGTWVEERQLFDRWFGVVCPIWKKIASCQPISCFARISFKIFQSFFFFFSFAVIYTSTTTSPKVKLPFSFCWNLYFFTARDALRGRHSSFRYQTEWNGTLVKWRWISNTRSEISWECMYTVVYNKYSPVAYFLLNYLFSQL